MVERTVVIFYYKIYNEDTVFMHTKIRFGVKSKTLESLDR